MYWYPVPLIRSSTVGTLTFQKLRFATILWLPCLHTTYLSIKHGTRSYKYYTQRGRRIITLVNLLSTYHI